MSFDNQLRTESLNSDGQQFHQNQKMNNHLSSEFTEHKQRQRHPDLGLDRHKMLRFQQVNGIPILPS